MQNIDKHQLMKIFDGFNEYVYVADMKTHELYYLNEAAKRKYHSADYEGKKCYEVVQGRSTPCPFCNNEQLSKEEFYCWEFQNAFLQSHGVLKDIIIDWYGKDARLEIANDLTHQDEQLRQLRLAHDMEDFTLQCVEILYKYDDPKDATDTILEALGTYLKAKRTYVIEPIDHRLFLMYEWCNEGVISKKEHMQNMDKSVIQEWFTSFRNHKSYFAQYPKYLKNPSNQKEWLLYDVESITTVPVFVKSHFIGCIVVENPDIGKLQSFPMLDTLGYFISLAFDKKAAKEELQHESDYDALTGLNNRKRYIQAIYQSEKECHIHGVVYLDVNDLKGTNDHLGHEMGDRMLKEAADYLTSVFSKEMVYRIGGDEFIALSKQKDETKFKEDIMSLRSLFMLSNSCSAAIGYAWQPHGNIHEMIKLADEAMYDDKKEYYRTHLDFHRYRATHDETLCLQVPHEVEKAIEHHRFHFYLQPKTSMDAKKIIGCEALVRYEDHNGKILSPIQFIPVLEQAKTIYYIDYYMFKRACETIVQWQKEGKTIHPISVNFSRYTLLRKEFLEELLDIWVLYGIERRYIEIEIIERTGNISGERLIQVMKEIKAAGFGVSIDDFGVKYSNLFLFSNTEIDTLKLDRSLILDLKVNEKSRMIIKALSALCDQFHIQMIVEGVETIEQLNILKELNCNGIQGYLVSKPLPLSEYNDLFVK